MTVDFPAHEASLEIEILKSILTLKEAKIICGCAIYHGVIQNFVSKEHFTDADPSEINFKDLCPNVK